MHKNARLTPLGREHMVNMVLSGQTPKAVGEGHERRTPCDGKPRVDRRQVCFVRELEDDADAARKAGQQRCRQVRMVARNERHDIRFGIGLSVIRTRRGLQSQQNRGSGDAGRPVGLCVRGIGQQLLQQNDMPKRIAAQLLDRGVGRDRKSHPANCQPIRRRYSAMRRSQ